jgi:hypothetical protein
MFRFSKSLLAALPLAAFPFSARESAAPRTLRADGHVIAMTISMSENDKTESIGMTMKLAGEKLRLEMDVSAMAGAMGAGDDAAMLKGAYMLVQGEGKIAMVMPSFTNPLTGSAGMGMIMNAEMMKGQFGGAMPSAPDVNITVTDLGPGETILGHPTRRYRVTENSTSTGTGAPDAVEVWLASDLADVEAGFKKLGNSFATSFFGPVFAGSAAGKVPPGFPLRVVGTTAAGKEVMRLDVSRAEKLNIDDKEFEVPAGIQMMDLGAMMKRGN